SPPGEHVRPSSRHIRTDARSFTDTCHHMPVMRPQTPLAKGGGSVPGSMGANATHSEGGSSGLVRVAWSPAPPRRVGSLAPNAQTRKRIACSYGELSGPRTDWPGTFCCVARC